MNRLRLSASVLIFILVFLIVVVSGYTLPYEKVTAGIGTQRAINVYGRTLPYDKAYSSPGISRFFVYFPLYLQTGIYLVPVEYFVAHTKTPARNAVEALIQGVPESLADSSGLMVVSLPKETEVLDMTIKDGLCTVDFSEDITRVSVGSGGEAALISAIVETLCQFPAIDAVRILVDGKTAESLAGHVDITKPLRGGQESRFQTFPDAVQHWGGGVISALQVSDVVNGYPDNTFRPDRKLTRAEFVKMLVETSRLPYSAQGQSAIFLNDVGDHWCRPYIERAVSNKILLPQDYGDTFRPDEAISREEASYLLLKGSDVYLANHPELILEAKDRDLKFQDEDRIQERYLAPVLECVKRGYIDGYPDGTFRPDSTLTRAEACAILGRMQGVQGKDVLLLGPKPGFRWDGSDAFVIGFATAFEANVNWRVKALSGASFISENYTTSSNGMGWGVFGLCIDRTLLQAEESLVLEVYLRDMKDGGEYGLAQVLLVEEK